MRERQDLVERFSTFIKWDNNQFQKWEADPRLRRSMERCLAQESSTSEQYWVLFWHKDWLNQRELAARQETRRASHHLHAYLQETCYQVAKNFERKYKIRLFQYTIEDYFNLGFLNLDQICSKFNSKLNSNLAAYAFKQIEWRVIDEIRKNERSFGHTIWSLLLSCTETRLREALKRQGISRETSIENYLIAWDCYKELYSQERVTSKGKLQEPNSETWKEITKAYNQVAPDCKCDVSIIRKWLRNCGQSLKYSLSILTTSSNVPISPETDEEIGNILTEPEQITPIKEAEKEEEEQEKQENFQKIHEWLKMEIEQLDSQTRLILEMFYGQQLNQTDIGNRFSPMIKQYQISREISKAQKRLGKQFIEWSAQNLNITPTTTDIENLANAIEEWLEYHYQNTSINK